MVKYLLVGAVCLAIGHYGPVAFGKMTMRGASTALVTGAKVLDTASKLAH